MSSSVKSWFKKKCTYIHGSTLPLTDDLHCRFEAFDEPWKVRFNEPGREWEDQWGVMTVNRELKPGVKIPDCGGETV